MEGTEVDEWLEAIMRWMGRESVTWYFVEILWRQFSEKLPIKKFLEKLPIKEFSEKVLAEIPAGIPIEVSKSMDKIVTDQIIIDESGVVYYVAVIYKMIRWVMSQHTFQYLPQSYNISADVTL